jgi:glucose/arabinose dehydrogenase
MITSSNTIWLYCPGWMIAIFLVVAAWPGSAQTRYASERVFKILYDERPRGLWLEDIDLDGDIDILHTTYGSGPEDSGTVAWFPNLGNGEFGETILIDEDLLGAESINTADLNNDGLMDLVVTSRVCNLVAVYDNLGSGDFGPRRIVDNDAPIASYAKAADFDGDGDLDLVVATEGGPNLFWYENDGFGAFIQQHQISADMNKNRFVWTEDLDVDGDIDILAATTGSNGQIFYFLNNGNGTFDTGTQLTSSSGSSHKWIRTEDLDADGDPEILSTCYTSGAVFVFENLGGAVFGPLTVLSTNNDGARFVWTGDLDADGDPDIMAASEYATRFSWIENKGSMTFGSEQVLSVKSEGPNEIYPADIDRDGDQDLVAICAYPEEFSRIVWFEQLNPDDPGTIQFDEFYHDMEDPVLFRAGPDKLKLMVERSGLILSLKERFTDFAVWTHQDLRPVIQRNSGTAGLVALELDPGYAANGFFYVAYETTTGMLRLSRFGQVGLPKNSPNIGNTEMFMLEVPMSGLERNMALTFGPDGLLYVAIGDGWQASSPTNVATDLDDLRGKILRVDVSGAAPYTIPPDNPYVGFAGALPEIWMSGIHQALGLHFDLETSDLWFVDRGESLWDEIHRFAAGTGAGFDLGWPGWEGTDSLRPGSVSSLVHFPDAVLPVQNLTGGIVYRGTQIPLFFNNFVAFSEESGNLYGFQDLGSEVVLANTAITHRPGLIDLTQDERLEMVAADASEKKMLYFLERCSSNTPPGKLYSDAYADGRVNYHFEYLPDASKFEVTVRNPEEQLLHRSIIFTNLEKVTDVPLGRTYIWRVRAKCNDGTITPYSAPDTIVMPGSLKVADSIGIEPVSNAVSVLYPNSERVWITISVSMDDAQLLIYDLQGRIAFVQNQIQNWPVEVDHSNWPAGMYLIQINTAAERMTSRMVVQH